MKKFFSRLLHRNGSDGEGKDNIAQSLPSDPVELLDYVHKLGQALEENMTKFEEECEEKDMLITSQLETQRRALTMGEEKTLSELSILTSKEKKTVHHNETAITISKSFLQKFDKVTIHKNSSRMIAFIRAFESIQIPKTQKFLAFIHKVNLPTQFHLGDEPLENKIFVQFDYWSVTRSFQSLIDASKKEIAKIPATVAKSNSGSAWALDVHRETGRIFFSSQSDGKIHAIDPPSGGNSDFTYVRTFQQAKGSNQISAMRISPDGKYLVAIDFSAHCAHIYDVESGDLMESRFSDADEPTRKSSIIPKKLSYGLGVAFDRSGNFYISDSSNRRVVSSSIDGSIVRELKNPAIGRVQGITIDSKERLWTMVVAGDKLNCFDLEGNLLKSYSVPRVSDVWPNSLANGPDNSIMILDWSGNTITQICSESGVVLGSLSINRPSMCAFGPDGTFYLAGYSDQIKYI
eukprot:TRINITY_DN5565_c0_g1_i1.p1 TRINITY_DN5565_c0_g1~~TRINITY_DN5565_c0_g1_i1.p1  ORF type:complete len:462 (-),score=123.31 TRINITY_DN5565_c0_g1_i1:190-1575(-)